MSSYPRTHFFLVWCSIESRVRRGRAQGSAWGVELGQYFYKCPSEYGQCWIPCSLVAASVPQNFFNVWTLRNAETYFTLITQYWSLSKQTAVCLQHMSDLYIIWFKEKKCFLECLCMNLNFKLFLFCFFFIKSTDLFWEKKLCKYLIYFISRKQKIYVWLQHKE